MEQKDYSQHKKVMIPLGIILLILGIIIIIFSMVTMFGTSSSLGWFGFSAVGLLMIFFGVVLLKFSFIRPISKYIATEASPAITKASHAIGQGLKESGAFDSSQKEIIKVKCPHCGYLESEDADFCSKCGKKL